jgi:CMP/dCMP kinase
MIVAIDGPAGSGKSTVARILAGRLGFLYIDTGAMYRAIALKVLLSRIDLGDEGKIIQCAKDSRIELRRNRDGSLAVILDGSDVSEAIRKPEIAECVSEVSRISGVRDVLVALQRSLAASGRVVMEGRDIGTVVFPNAEKKFFLDAAFDERVNRRYQEFTHKGRSIPQHEVAQDLRKRDAIDSGREVAPLRKAPDAVYVDTSSMSIDEVVEMLYRAVTQE